MTIVRQTVAPLVLLLVCAGCGSGKDPLSEASVAAASSPPASSNPPTLVPTTAGKPAPKSSAPNAAQATLPRGGREVFPRYRLVGYAGVTGASTLGRLGTGPLDQRVAEIERRAKPYADGREVLPVVEVIATIVQGSPGRDGKYRVRLTDTKLPNTTMRPASIEL